MDDDYVNLEGVFIKDRPEPPKGIQLTPITNLADLLTIVNKKVHASRLNVVGLWYCANKACNEQPLKAETYIIFYDGLKKISYIEDVRCAQCQTVCDLLPVFIWMVYLSWEGYVDLSVWLRGQAASPLKRDRGMAEVHVFADRGEKPATTDRPHTVRLLGPFGSLVKGPDS